MLIIKLLKSTIWLYHNSECNYNKTQQYQDKISHKDEDGCTSLFTCINAIKM